MFGFRQESDYASWWKYKCLVAVIQMYNTLKRNEWMRVLFIQVMFRVKQMLKTIRKKVRFESISLKGVLRLLRVKLGSHEEWIESNRIMIQFTWINVTFDSCKHGDLN